MPQLIRPGDVKVVTKDGECLVNIQLELTIKLDGNGLSVGSVQALATPDTPQKKEEVAWQIPNFGGGPKLKFGQDVK